MARSDRHSGEHLGSRGAICPWPTALRSPREKSDGRRNARTRNHSRRPVLCGERPTKSQRITVSVDPQPLHV
jgi:hypothetical protein